MKNPQKCDSRVVVRLSFNFLRLGGGALFIVGGRFRVVDFLTTWFFTTQKLTTESSPDGGLVATDLEFLAKRGVMLSSEEDDVKKFE